MATHIATKKLRYRYYGKYPTVLGKPNKKGKFYKIPDYTTGTEIAVYCYPLLKKRIQKIFNNTMIEKYIGSGRDSHGIKFKKFKVCNVYVIKNPKLARKYKYRVGRIYEKNKRKNITQIKCATDGAKIELDHQINEKILFHGTSPKNIQSIVNEGLHKGESGLFGKGIYFAENISKSDEYIMEDADGFCWVILARVCMGNPCITTKQKDISKIRKKNSLLAECKRTSRKKRAFLMRYREFVINRNSQCYPEFIVKYKRV